METETSKSYAIQQVMISNIKLGEAFTASKFSKRFDFETGYVSAFCHNAVKKGFMERVSISAGRFHFKIIKPIEEMKVNKTPVVRGPRNSVVKPKAFDHTDWKDRLLALMTELEGVLAAPPNLSAVPRSALLAELMKREK